VKIKRSFNTYNEIFMPYSQSDLINIVSNFEITDGVAAIENFGMGHINDTYVVNSASDNQPGYLLQRVNHMIFKDVPALMNNILLVTDHLKSKLRSIPGADPETERDPGKRDAIERALRYMALEPNVPVSDIRIDKVFIGSCTNSRIEDLREAAAVVRRLGTRVAANVKLAMVVPGSGLVKEQAEREGLDLVFKGAGFEWREPGCSMCLAMNADRLEPGERCASTSNRNFEGRQGAGGRTHLVSPAMAAAAAIEGHFVDVRRLT